MHIRTIRAADNPRVEQLIRTCLIEFHADHEGTAWADPDLGRFSEIYADEWNRYWVAFENEQLVAGVGIGLLDQTRGICELQKMYCQKEFRGSGIAQQLLDTALSYAAKRYLLCYLETLDNMTAAQRFYERNGFERITEPVVQTEHFACDVRYLKVLKQS